MSSLTNGGESGAFSPAAAVLAQTAAASVPVVVLVHGTFAPRAPWTQPGSPLREALVSRLKNPAFEVPIWTGKNTFQARIDAAGMIIQTLAQVVPGTPVAIIAHSHGGSAIAYAKKARPDLFVSVRAVVCLATPFFGFSVRPGYQALLAAFVACSVFLSFQVLLATATITGRRLSPRFNDQPYGVAVIGMALVFAAVYVAVKVWRGRVRIYRFFERVLRDASFWDTTQGTWERTLFVRSMGDEVGLGIGTLQFASMVLNRILNGVASLTSWALAWGQRWSVGWIGKFRVALILLPLVVVSGIPAAVSAEFGYRPRYWIDVLNPWSLGFSFVDPIFGPADQAARAAYAVALLILSLPSLVAMLFSVSMVFASLLSLAMTGALGHMSLRLGIATQWAVEPTPEGACQFLNGGWTRDALRLGEMPGGLQHSEPYSSHGVVNAVVCFVGQHMGE